jgi:hypothetical protein
MSDTERHFDNEPDATVSPRFAEDLGKLFAPDRPVPSHVDRAVAEAARRHFAPRTRRLWRLRWALPATAAAAILVAASAWWFHAGPASQSAPVPSAPFVAEASRVEGLAEVSLIQADVDGNGTVNILDAFTLARHVDAQRPSEAKWDMNADGLVDRRDVDAVALAAVRLNKGV